MMRVNEPLPLLYWPSSPATSARTPVEIRDKACEVVTPDIEHASMRSPQLLPIPRKESLSHVLGVVFMVS